MSQRDIAGEIPENPVRYFIALTKDDFTGLSVPDGEYCPRCGSDQKVRGATNRWLCKKCNRQWFRKLT